MSATSLDSDDLGERLLRICEMTDAMFAGFTPHEHATIRRINSTLASGHGGHLDHLRLEDQLIVLLHRSQGMHDQTAWGRACDLFLQHKDCVEWQYLERWAELHSLEWALPLMRGRAGSQ